MAFRHPHSPRHDRLERWQTVAARSAGLFLLAGMLALAFLFADWAVPPQHLFWKPLKLSDPVGAATAPKVAANGIDPAACRAVLAAGGISFRSVPDQTHDFCTIRNAVVLTQGGARLSPDGAVMSCQEAMAFALWDRQVVQPAAIQMFGSPVVVIEHYGSYACRREYGRPDGPVSEHAYANALDVAAFRLADGRRIDVESQWSTVSLQALFLRRVRNGACRVFSTTLSPDYNVEHHNHLHLDMAARGACH